MSVVIKGLRSWLGEALAYTMGTTNETKHQPPSIGIQPYKDFPEKTR